jgi:large subunit ribosomal protein L30
MAERLRITQVRSAIGYKYDQAATLKALGLGKMWRTVEHPDNPVVRGMINKVRHLVRVEPANAAPPPAPPKPPEFTVLEEPLPAGEDASPEPPASESEKEEQPS